MEVLIASVIVTVGMAGVMYALSRGVFASTVGVENVDLSLGIAQKQMEMVRNTAFASLAPSGPTTDPDFPGYSVTVTVTGADPKQVGVIVSSVRAGGTDSTTLTTLRSNY